MIRAYIFDFNGVIVDDEPVHLKLFQKVFQEEGIDLSEDEYQAKYLGYDDHDLFTKASIDKGIVWEETKIKELIDRKERYYKQGIEEIPYVKGSLEFLSLMSEKHYVGICSGALRSEVVYLLKLAKVYEKVNVIVAAEDMEKGKPDPSGYLKVLRILNRDFVQDTDPMLANECMVFEDSPWGIQAALGAGMNCVGITTSYAADQLNDCLTCFPDFSCVTEEGLIKLVQSRA